MKSAFLWLGLCFSTSLMAVTVDAPGKIFFIDQEGALTKQDATLGVPSRGQGEVTLTGDHWSATSQDFFSIHYHGRTVFYVLFRDFGHNHRSVLFRGTYLRGTNKAAYWGDFYEGHCGVGKALRECIEHPEQEVNPIYWRHAGGFAFRSPGETPPKPEPALPAPGEPEPGEQP